MVSYSLLFHFFSLQQRTFFLQEEAVFRLFSFVFGIPFVNMVSYNKPFDFAGVKSACLCLLALRFLNTLQR